MIEGEETSSGGAGLMKADFAAVNNTVDGRMDIHGLLQLQFPQHTPSLSSFDP
jgi:hypothetical protein